MPPAKRGGHPECNSRDDQPKATTTGSNHSDAVGAQRGAQLDRMRRVPRKSQRHRPGSVSRLLPASRTVLPEPPNGPDSRDLTRGIQPRASAGDSIPSGPMRRCPPMQAKQGPTHGITPKRWPPRLRVILPFQPCGHMKRPPHPASWCLSRQALPHVLLPLHSCGCTALG